MDGEVTVLADIFPAEIRPLPPGVPGIVRLRAIVSAGMLTIAWSAGRNGLEPIIGRADIPYDNAHIESGNRGGTAGPYTVRRARGCACGAAGLQNWNPFPGKTVIRV